MGEHGNDAILVGADARTRSFRRSHLLYRALWELAWRVLAAWTPAPLHPWRRLVLRAFGATLGPGARVHGSARIFDPRQLTMGRESVLGRWTWCQSIAPVVIGDHVEIAQFVHLVTGSHDVDDPAFQLRARPIHLGAHAWLASGALVGPGVTVGEGAVLGARGVALRDLAQWTVYAGNPAAPVRPRRRFLEDQP